MCWRRRLNAMLSAVLTDKKQRKQIDVVWPNIYMVLGWIGVLQNIYDKLRLKPARMSYTEWTK